MPVRRNLHTLDWSILGIYLVGIVAMGLWLSRRQQNPKEYFIGSGGMNSFLIGISIFTAKMSSISYLAYPGEVIKHGPMILFGLISIPLAYWIVGYWLLPRYMTHKVTSAYELLEKQLGLTGRLLGAGMFIISRVIWMGILVYLSANALIVILDLPSSSLPWMILATSFFSILYTSLGGLRAVVVTDSVQFLLFFLGAVLTVIIISINMGGVSQWWPTQWATHWDHQPLISFDPTVRVSLMGVILMHTVWRVCAAGGDQLSVQRFMATTDLVAARRSFLVNSVAGVLVIGTLALVGLALLGYFSQNATLIPYSGTLTQEADRLFPFFIAEFLPPGVSGFLIVAIFAAAMSSIDSGVNSITAVVQNDLLQRFGLSPSNPRSALRFSMALAFAVGSLVVLLSCFVIGRVPGNFLEIAQRTSNLLIAPLFSLFVMAFFIPFANACGALLAVAYGLSTSFCVAYWGILTSRPSISFMYIDSASLFIGLSVGITVSWLTPPHISRSRYIGTLLGAFGLLGILWGLVITLRAC